MKKYFFGSLILALFSSISTVGQQAHPEPLTFWYEYVVNQGREADFMDLITTVGQPVRDQLMAEGVINAWGVEVPLLRQPGIATHVIWYEVSDWSGVEKVDSAMRVQIAKLSADVVSKSPAAKKAPKSNSVMDRLREDVDMSKTHDYLTRDLVINGTSSLPANVMPFTRYNYVKVKSGKGSDYRKAWEKYNKPILDKLIANGDILWYGLSVEEVRTDGDFTHFAWIETKDLAGFEKLRNAFNADREHRSEEERNSINALFATLIDAEASRSAVNRSIVYHFPNQK
jgi:hypothetical protein